MTTRLKSNKLISRTTGFLFIGIFALIGVVFLLNSRAAVTPTNIGFETANDPKCNGGINTTPSNSSFNQNNTKAYEGTYSAKASYTGGTENAYARCVVTTSWITGDEVWYGGAFFLPSGFSQSMQNQVDLMRWDNFSLNNASQDWGGIIIQNNDKQARLKRFNVSGDYTDVSTPFAFPENRWVWVEVHQKFSPTDGQAINEVYIDGSLQSSSTKANTYGREITRIRYGLVAIGAGSQTNPLNLWLDRATISPSKLGPKTSGNNNSTFGNWKWDARSAKVASNSNTIIPKWLKYAKINPNVPTGSFAVATAEAKTLDPTYSVTLTEGGYIYKDSSGSPSYLGKGSTITLRIPLNSKPDPSSDGHITIRDEAAGYETDFWQAKYDANTGRITSASAAAQFPIDSVSVGCANDTHPAGCWSGNAAGTPLRRGLITPENLSDGVINQTLQFAHRSIGGTTTSYKYPGEHNANTCSRWYDPTKGTGNFADLGYASYTEYLNDCNANYLPEGTWMRLDPNLNIDAITPALPAWQKTVAKAMQNYGMVLRDNGGTLSVYGENTINRGGNSLWAPSGLSTGNSTGFASNFPWASMQVLDPPSTTTPPPPPPKKPGDVNGDTLVNIDDLSILLSKWNTNYTPADFYKDNTIDISDLSILLGNWGK